jgi:putative ABC transport system permease protein
MLQDLRLAARSLRHAGAVPLIAVATLAIGIGGVAAMFTVVNQVVLDPVPFRDSDRLVLIWGSKPHENQPELPFSQPDFQDVRAQAQSFEAIGGWALGRGNLIGGDPEQIQWAVVTSNLFEILGATPGLGRPFTSAEEQPGTRPVAIITHALWQRRLDGSPDVIGRTLTLDNRSIEIVGVLPRDFSFLTFPSRTDVWLPLGADPFEGRRFARGARSMGVIARMRPGTTLAQTRAEGETIAAGLATAYPFFNTGRRFAIVPLRDQVAREARDGAFVLFAAVGCVLFIACANVSSLMLARATSRQRDVLIRTALGASRWRIIRHQLAESTLVAGAGGAAGLLLAVWLIDLLAKIPYRTDSLFVPYAVARDALHVDPLALAFTLAVTVGSALLFSVAPALRHVDVIGRTGCGSRRWARRHVDLLHAGARATADRSQRRLGAVLVVAEVALALTLLVSAGLMARSLLRLQTVDPGFSAPGVLSLQMTLSRSSYPTPARQAGFFSEALTRLRSLPGVTGVAAAEILPFSGLDSSTGFFIEGRPDPARGDQQQTHPRAISDSYFEVMGMRMVAGRPFGSGDRTGAARVAVINETMARTFWPGESPLGRKVALDLETLQFFPDRPPIRNVPTGMREIVGIVGDIRHNSLQQAPQPEMYVPFLQRPVTDMTVVVRTTGDPLALAAPSREVIRAIDPNQPIANVDTVSGLVARSTGQPRSNSWILTAFAAVALLLAMIGVFGLVAHDVAQRTRELGIRLALGEQPGGVRALIIGGGFRLVVAGLVLGIPSALAAGRLLSSQLFNVSPADPLTLAAAAAILLAVSLAACAIPARRATRIDPVQALRSE